MIKLAEGTQLSLLSLEPHPEHGASSEEASAMHAKDVAYFKDYVFHHQGRILRAAQALYDNETLDNHNAYLRLASDMRVAVSELDALVGLPSTFTKKRRELNITPVRRQSILDPDTRRELWGGLKIDRGAPSTPRRKKTKKARVAKAPAPPPAPPAPVPPLVTVRTSARVTMTLTYPDGTQFPLPEVPLDKIDALVEAAKAFGKVL